MQKIKISFTTEATESQRKRLKAKVLGREIKPSTVFGLNGGVLRRAYVAADLFRVFFIGQSER